MKEHTLRYHKQPFTQFAPGDALRARASVTLPLDVLLAIFYARLIHHGSNNFDSVAITRQAGCEIEKALGTFPNIMDGGAIKNVTLPVDVCKDEGCDPAGMDHDCLDDKALIAQLRDHIKLLEEGNQKLASDFAATQEQNTILKLARSNTMNENVDLRLANDKLNVTINRLAVENDRQASEIKSLTNLCRNRAAILNKVANDVRGY